MSSDSELGASGPVEIQLTAPNSWEVVMSTGEYVGPPLWAMKKEATVFPILDGLKKIGPLCTSISKKKRLCYKQGLSNSINCKY